MEPPPGYPPPTLIRKRSRGLSPRVAILFLVLFAGLGFFIVNNLLDRPAAPSGPAVAPAPAPLPPSPVETDQGGVASADAAPAALPDTAKPAEPAPPPVVVEQPVEDGAAAAARDARKANQWYFVGKLGDGPGAIYSRNGGQWNFAFACTVKTHMIEFIAVGTGAPGDFQGQVITVGSYKLAMDAIYSKLGGGTISTTLPASHPFFNALDGSAPMEVQLVADRKTIVPIGPNVVRLIKSCRG